MAEKHMHASWCHGNDQAEWPNGSVDAHIQTIRDNKGYVISLTLYTNCPLCAFMRTESLNEELRKNGLDGDLRESTYKSSNPYLYAEYVLK